MNGELISHRLLPSAPDRAVGLLRVEVVVARGAKCLGHLAEDLVGVSGAYIPLRLPRLIFARGFTGPPRAQRREAGLEAVHLLPALPADPSPSHAALLYRPT